MAAARRNGADTSAQVEAIDEACADLAGFTTAATLGRTAVLQTVAVSVFLLDLALILFLVCRQ